MHTAQIWPLKTFLQGFGYEACEPFAKEWAWEVKQERWTQSLKDSCG